MKDILLIGMLLTAVVIMNSCGGSRPTPPPPQPPPMKKVMFAWEAGECHDIFTLYEITATGKRAVSKTDEPTVTLVIQPRESQWQVSGLCGTEEYFSEIAALQP